MLGSKVITFASVLIVLICVVLSITAAPVSSPDELYKRAANNKSEDDTILQADQVPVTSNGNGNLTAYNDNDTKKANVDGNNKGNNKGGVLVKGPPKI